MKSYDFDSLLAAIGVGDAGLLPPDMQSPPDPQVEAPPPAGDPAGGVLAAVANPSPAAGAPPGPGGGLYPAGYNDHSTADRWAALLGGLVPQLAPLSSQIIGGHRAQNLAMARYQAGLPTAAAPAVAAVAPLAQPIQPRTLEEAAQLPHGVVFQAPDGRTIRRRVTP